MAKGSGGGGHGGGGAAGGAGGSFVSLAESRFEDNSEAARAGDSASWSRSDALKGKATEAQKDSVALYGMPGGYQKIRKADRGELKDKRYVQHAANINAVLAQAPKYQQTAFRGMAVSPKQLKQLMSSKTITAEAMTSSSRSNLSAAQFVHSNTSRARPYGVILKLKSKSGADISTITGIRSEREVMFAKGTRFKIDKMTRTKLTAVKTLVIHAHEI